MQEPSESSVTPQGVSIYTAGLSHSFAAVLFWRALSLARPGAPESVTSLAGLYWPVLSSVAAKLRDSPAAVSIDRTQGAYPGMVILMECVPGLSLMRLGVLPA